jgi:hypothetical protein
MTDNLRAICKLYTNHTCIQPSLRIRTYKDERKSLQLRINIKQDRLNILRISAITIYYAYAQNLHYLGLYSTADKQAMSKTIISIYIGISLPTFYVLVLFIDLPQVSFYIGRVHNSAFSRFHV